MLFAPKEKGQGLVEYALILVLVAIVVIAVLMLLGPIIGNVFSTINDSLSGVWIIVKFQGLTSEAKSQGEALPVMEQAPSWPFQHLNDSFSSVFDPSIRLPRRSNFRACFSTSIHISLPLVVTSIQPL